MSWRPGTCIEGFDWGSTVSKATLSWINKDGQKEITRVPFKGDVEDPEHPHTSRFSGSMFEFVSSAALMGPNLIVGRQSLRRDDSFPTKTLVLWAAGIRRPLTMEKAPGGREILEAVATGKINMDTVEIALLQHLRLVHRLARAKAEMLGLEIVHISNSHPNFLCDGEEGDDFRRLSEYIRRLVRIVCGEKISISMINEGQALAIYITEIFQDPFESFNRKDFWARLRHLKKSEGLKLLVVDCGGSTTNMQVQIAFFNDQHEMTASQSINYPNWRTGVQGGSHLANFRVRSLIKKTIGTDQNSETGELAVLLNDFEFQKRTIDWTKTPLPTITLHGNKPSSKFTIPPDVLKPIFKTAFQGGLNCLQEMGENVLESGQDFAIVLCGGSYYDRGLRKQVVDVVRQLQVDAQCRKVNVEYIFLVNHDSHWSSGVSAGAALSVLRLPYPTDVLDYASIGLQSQWPQSEGGLIGENSASFLLSKGCQIMPSITVWNDPHEPDPITFTLVCDPVHYRTPPAFGDRAPRGETKESFDRIPISPRKHTIPAYDMGFSFNLSDLPPGHVKITLGGADATAFAKNLEFPTETRTLEFELIAHKVNARGRKMPHRLDKRWLLRLETDGATKHVIVEDANQIPPRCRCPNECHGVPAVHQCLTGHAPAPRVDRPRRVRRRGLDPGCRATCARGRRLTRSAGKVATSNVTTPRALESIEVAAPSRSVSPGYESITSVSSTGE